LFESGKYRSENRKYGTGCNQFASPHGFQKAAQSSSPSVSGPLPRIVRAGRLPIRLIARCGLTAGPAERSQLLRPELHPAAGWPSHSRSLAHQSLCIFEKSSSTPSYFNRGRARDVFGQESRKAARSIIKIAIITVGFENCQHREFGIVLVETRASSRKLRLISYTRSNPPTVNRFR